MSQHAHKKLSSIKPKVDVVNLNRASPSGVERIRGGKLQKIRERILRRDGWLCQECLKVGRTTIAKEIDHRVPLHLGGAESDANRWSLCRSCHDLKSAQESRERTGRGG
jgi:5-methylcytosine-specific restriction enzyme A